MKSFPCVEAQKSLTKKNVDGQTDRQTGWKLQGTRISMHRNFLQNIVKICHMGVNDNMKSLFQQPTQSDDSLLDLTST